MASAVPAERRSEEGEQQEDEEEGSEEAEEPETDAVAPAIPADVGPDGVIAGRDDHVAGLCQPLADSGVVSTDPDEGDGGDDHQGHQEPGDASSVHVDVLSVCVAIV
jgi:hypothetical protein